MVAFARNLTGITEIRGPKLARDNKPKHHTRRQNRLDRGVRVNTRELKLHIAILDSWLSNPVEVAKLSEEIKGGMVGRLSFYRLELAKRDERDNRTSSAPALLASMTPVAVANQMHA